MRLRSYRDSAKRRRTLGRLQRTDPGPTPLDALMVEGSARLKGQLRRSRLMAESHHPWPDQRHRCFQLSRGHWRNPCLRVMTPDHPIRLGMSRAVRQ